MDEFEDYDDGFPAVGESDGMSECCDEGFLGPGESDCCEAASDVFWPASPCQGPDGFTNHGTSPCIGETGGPSPCTPIARLPLQSEDTPTSTESCDITPSNDVAARASTGRKRLRAKTKPGQDCSFTHFDERRRVYLKHELLSAYRRLACNSKRVWNKRLHVQKNRVCQRARAGQTVKLTDGSTWIFVTEQDWIRGQHSFTWRWYCAIADNGYLDRMLRASAMSTFLTSYTSVAEQQPHLEHVTKGMTALLTWQGPWGVLADVPVDESDHGRSISSVCEKVHRSPSAQLISDDTRNLRTDLLEKHTLHHFAISTEFSRRH